MVPGTHIPGPCPQPVSWWARQLGPGVGSVLALRTDSRLLLGTKGKRRNSRSLGAARQREGRGGGLRKTASTRLLEVEPCRGSFLRSPGLLPPHRHSPSWTLPKTGLLDADRRRQTEGRGAGRLRFKVTHRTHRASPSLVSRPTNRAAHVHRGPKAPTRAAHTHTPTHPWGCRGCNMYQPLWRYHGLSGRMGRVGGIFTIAARPASCSPRSYQLAAGVSSSEGALVSLLGCVLSPGLALSPLACALEAWRCGVGERLGGCQRRRWQAEGGLDRRSLSCLGLLGWPGGQRSSGLMLCCPRW